MASNEASFAVIDLSISLLSFVNIELRSQGWYAVRTRLLPDPRIKAVWPYRTALSEAAEQQPSDQQVGQAEEGWSWHSKVFPVRYTLEEVALGESPCFQVFLRNPTDSLSAASLRVELELLHHEADIVSNLAPPTTFRLKPVGRDVIRLTCVCEGAAAYYPITWGPAHLGLCHTTFYTLLSGFVPARMLNSLRATTGRDLRRPISRRIPSAKFERSLSLASSNNPSKRGGWRGLMCGNVDTDQVMAPTAIPISRVNSNKEEALSSKASSHHGPPQQLLQGPHNLVGVLQGLIQGDNNGDPEAALSEQQQARLRHVYEALAVLQYRAVSNMSHLLRGLPASCYHPQSYDVLRTLVGKEINPHGSPEPSPSPLPPGSHPFGAHSPRGATKLGLSWGARTPAVAAAAAAARTEAGKAASPTQRAPGAAAAAVVAVDVPDVAAGLIERKPREQQQQQQQQQWQPQGVTTELTAATTPKVQAGPKYVGSAPSPLTVTPAQIAMTSSPTFADVTPPPFSLSRISRSLGLGDHTWSSGVTEPTSPTSHKSESPHHPSLLSLASPSHQPTPPITMPAAPPILLTPPEPMTTPSDTDAADQTGSLPPQAAVCGARDSHLRPGSDCTRPKPPEDAAPAAPSHAAIQADPACPSVPPLKLPPRCTGGGAAATPVAATIPKAPSLHSLHDSDAPGKIVANATDSKGGSLAMPRVRTHVPHSGSSAVLLPPLPSSRASRKLNNNQSDQDLRKDDADEMQSCKAAGTPPWHSRQSAAGTAPQAEHAPHSKSALEREMHQSCQGSRNSSAAESSGESIALEVSSWPEVPNTATFISWLPPACSLGTAVLYIDAVLARLRTAASSEWAVLQWVLRMSNTHATRFFKCQWEGEQPWVVQPWVAIGKDALTAVATASALEAKACAVRQSLQQRVFSLQLLPPQLHQTRIWDFPGQQPILIVDDSWAPHIRTWCMVRDPQEPQQPQQPGPAPCMTSRASPEPDSLHSYTRNNKGTHVCVFVHGYQGNATDLSLIKGQLAMLYPHIDMMCSKANEGKTQESLQAMGERLAVEVCDKLALLGSQPQQRPLAALSFVGHSLGTLIVRAALASPKMAPYLPKLEMFISICGPHLGQLYSKNGLVDMGVGFLKLMSVKGGSLHQLALSDGGSNNMRASWLYKLATSAPQGPGSLQLFRNVVLVASAQDRYVPWHSARLAMCETAGHDSKQQRKEVFTEMLQASTQGFGGDPGTPQLLRVDVDFPPQGTNSSFFNNLLGRTAHIALIEDLDFARCLVWGVVRRYKLIRPDVVGAWLPAP